jgi:methyl-accepting chemotaxis protein
MDTQIDTLEGKRVALQENGQMGMTTTGSEEEKRLNEQILARRAQFALDLTGYVAWGAAILAIILLVTWLFSRQYIQLLGCAPFLVLLTAGAGMYPVFHRRGRATTGAYLTLGSLLLTCVACFVLVPEAELGVLGGYVIAIVMGNLFLGPKNGLRLIVVSALFLIADITLAKVVTPTWFIPLDETLGLFASVVFSSIPFLVAAIIIRQAVSGQERYFTQSLLGRWEIERRVAAEQAQRKYLQATVQKYVEYANIVGQGDLTARLTLDGDGQGADDPLIVLGHRLNETTANLQGMIAQIRDAADNLSSAAAEILAATTQQVAGASEQSAAISQTTITVDEVKTIAEQSAARAREVAGASQRTVEVSVTGQQTLQDTAESMTQIKDRVEGIAENILALSEQTQQIGEIIATVNEIAAQSNMLALNASVEAARAGEHGKGFAVVAAEVRNLAEQSRQATAQVKTILSDIQRATNSTVMATEEATKGVDAGVLLSAQTREAIERLSGVINESAQTATQVVAGGQQQQSGIEQIAQAMQNINQATTQSLASTRQAERAAQNLNELARSLTGTVELYQLGA